MKNINPKEAAEAITAGALVLDVRTPAEFSDAHIPGAKNIDIYDSAFTQSVRALDPKATYVVNCQSGGRSARACMLMGEFGFDNLLNIEEGISAWKAAGLPTEGY